MHASPPFTKTGETAFNNLVDLITTWLQRVGPGNYIDLIWGAVLTRCLTTARFGGLGNTRSAGHVRTPTLALVERERGNGIK